MDPRHWPGIDPGGPDRAFPTRAQAPFSLSVFRIDFRMTCFGIFYTYASFFSPISVTFWFTSVHNFHTKFPPALFIYFNTFLQSRILENHGFINMKLWFLQNNPSQQCCVNFGLSTQFRSHFGVLFAYKLHTCLHKCWSTALDSFLAILHPNWSQNCSQSFVFVAQFSPKARFNALGTPPCRWVSFLHRFGWFFSDSFVQSLLFLFFRRF